MSVFRRILTPKVVAMAAPVLIGAGLGPGLVNAAAGAARPPNIGHLGHGERRPASLAKRADYALYEVHYRGGWRTVSVSRGAVVALTGSTLTLRRPDGATVTAAVTAATRFRGTPKGAVRPGDKAMVVEVGNARSGLRRILPTSVIIERRRREGKATQGVWLGGDGAFGAHLGARVGYPRATGGVAGYARGLSVIATLAWQRRAHSF